VPAPTGNDSNQMTLNTFREGDAMMEKIRYVLWGVGLMATTACMTTDD
jgi:hypothetical protein